VTILVIFMCGKAMIHSKFNPPQLSLEHMQRGLRMALAIAEPVHQPVLVVSATNEVNFNNA
jgi:hypothetical protein